MRTLPYFLLVFCLGLIVHSASATRIVIQDPTGGVPVVSSPFQVAFSGSCQSFLSPNNPEFDDAGCFGFINATGSSWSGLTLTLETGSPSGNAFACSSPDVFSSESCGFNANLNTFVLSFTGGDVPSDRARTYVISEDDLPPADLTFRADITFAATTPEPSGLVLLGTGLLGTGIVLKSRRRASA